MDKYKNHSLGTNRICIHLVYMYMYLYSMYLLLMCFLLTAMIMLLFLKEYNGGNTKTS